MRGGLTLVGHRYEEGSLSLPYLAFVEAMRSYVLDRKDAMVRLEFAIEEFPEMKMQPSLEKALEIKESSRKGAKELRWP